MFFIILLSDSIKITRKNIFYSISLKGELDLIGMLDFDASKPLYEQLYENIAQEIQTGSLKQGQKMSGKRTLAERLGISVNAVDTAYQMLVAEGYLESRPRSGFYVMEVEKLAEISPIFSHEESLCKTQWKFDFSTAAIDKSLFPFRTWGRIQKELLYSKPQLLSMGDGQGDLELRETLAQHLQRYRGVKCSPNQIVIGAGIEYLLGLLMPLLGGTIALEDPGYPKAKRVIENANRKWIAVPVDKNGLSVAELSQTDAQAVYVTPSHQFPTAVTMPVGRRAALLAWAAADPARFIIEDDYDSEFRFGVRPLPSLQGMAQNGKVIYISTFSKSLAPSIRIACMVLPHTLIKPWKQRYGEYASTVSRFEQQTLCEFIQQGHLSRHLSRLRNSYRKRMEQFKNALQQCLGKSIKIYGEHTGLHFLIEFETASEQQLLQAACKHGLKVSGLKQYCSAESKQKTAVVLVGYGCLAEEQIMPAAQALQQAWKEYL